MLTFKDKRKPTAQSFTFGVLTVNLLNQLCGYVLYERFVDIATKIC